MRSRRIERNCFALLLALVSAGFVWVIFPLFGAIIWAVALAVVCRPVNRALARRWPRQPTLVAAITTIGVLVLVVLPAALMAGFIVQEATALGRRWQSGEIDVAAYYQRIISALPGWLAQLLNGAGLDDLPALVDKLKESAARGTQPIATRAWIISQATLDLSVSFLVMLYLLFFLLRDGDALMLDIARAVPLERHIQRRLFERFGTVIRSTLKGNVAVAALQGALGGIALMVLGIPAALLWAVLMAFLSLLPAVGAALVWGPIALYLIADGQLWQGVGLIAFGALVIGLVDNVVRPILVGKETRMPDYVVLITTIGGLSLFGINGIVIGPLIAALFIAAWDIFAAPPAGAAPTE
jgi:predicted PurR-regulated permease PerM